MIDWFINQPDYISTPILIVTFFTLALIVEKILYLLGI